MLCHNPFFLQYWFSVTQFSIIIDNKRLPSLHFFYDLVGGINFFHNMFGIIIRHFLFLHIIFDVTKFLHFLSIDCEILLLLFEQAGQKYISWSLEIADCSIWNWLSLNWNRIWLSVDDTGSSWYPTIIFLLHFIRLFL